MSAASGRPGGGPTHRSRRWRPLLVSGLLLTLLVGCTGDRDRPADGASGRPTGTVTVFAAASLTEAFTRLGADFEAAHPGTRIVFSFAGSSQLAQQINAGAPADVFAAANPATMLTVTRANTSAGEPRTFARNRLVIVVPEGNPRRVSGPADLAASGVKVALCAPQVPCGAAAVVALRAAGVTLSPVTQELDVRAVLTKVRLGEVDAALVYHTDALTAADEVDAIEFPGSAEAVNDYPILALPEAPNLAGAAAFVAYVFTAPARQVLTGAGFATP